jgi:hypothetical protein
VPVTLADAQLGQAQKSTVFVWPQEIVTQELVQPQA